MSLIEEFRSSDTVPVVRERIAQIVESLKYPEGEHPYLTCQCPVCLVALAIRQGKAG